MKISIKLDQFISDLNLKWIVKPEKQNTNPTLIYGISRVGLELSNFDISKKHPKYQIQKSLILLSQKEQYYVEELSEQQKLERYKIIIKGNPPLVVLTQTFTDKTFVKVAQKYNCPVVQAGKVKTSKLMLSILNKLEFLHGEKIEVHASMVNIFGLGVLIKGISGIGKSESVLSLIKRNHLFVGDDRIIVRSIHNKLTGYTHPILKNMIELRGIGIIDLSTTYGCQSLLTKSPIDLIINLKIFDNVDEALNLERLGNKVAYESLLGVDVPTLTIPVLSGRNIADLIEMSVVNLKRFQIKNETPLDKIEQRWDKYIKNI